VSPKEDSIMAVVSMSRIVLALALAGLMISSTAEAATCSQAVKRCISEGGRKAGIVEMCGKAGERCMREGVFIGPVTNRRWEGLQTR
jgi:hypothetical protein